MIYHDEDGNEYEMVAQEKRPNGNIIIKHVKKSDRATHKQLMAGIAYYLKWSTAYLKASRAGDTEKMQDLEKSWNPEKVLHDGR